MGNQFQQKMDLTSLFKQEVVPIQLRFEKQNFKNNTKGRWQKHPDGWRLKRGRCSFLQKKVQIFFAGLQMTLHYSVRTSPQNTHKPHQLPSKPFFCYLIDLVFLCGPPPRSPAFHHNSTFGLNRDLGFSCGNPSEPPHGSFHVRSIGSRPHLNYPSQLSKAFWLINKIFFIFLLIIKKPSHFWSK